MDNFDYSAIGQRIKTLRKRKGLNQTQLATLLGKSLRTMQKYETGEIEVSIDVVNSLAKHLDTTPTFILGYETNTSPIRNLSDIMSFLFELNRVSSLKFDIDVKRPPRSNEWTCSIRFNGKATDAEHNADMCLFLEEWEEMREAMRTYSCSLSALHRWQEETLAYHASGSVECVDPEELDNNERLARRRAYLEQLFNSME